MASKLFILYNNTIVAKCSVKEIVSHAMQHHTLVIPTFSHEGKDLQMKTKYAWKRWFSDQSIFYPKTQKNALEVASGSNMYTDKKIVICTTVWNFIGTVRWLSKEFTSDRAQKHLWYIYIPVFTGCTCCNYMFIQKVYWTFEVTWSHKTIIYNAVSCLSKWLYIHSDDNIHGLIINTKAVGIS